MGAVAPERLLGAEARALGGVPARGRVAHVVRTFGTLSETFVPDSIGALDRIGWEGWVVTMSVQNRDVFPFPPDERMLTGRRPPRAEQAVNRLALRPPSARRAEWLRPALELAQPDVVHAHFGWAAIDVMSATSALGLPLLATFLMPDPMAPRSRSWRREYARLYGNLTGAIAVSKYVAELLRSDGYRGPIHVVPTGVAVERFTFRGPRANSDEKRLLFIGRLVAYKGLDVLLRALPATCAAHPETRLEVLGDGPQRAEFESLVQKLRLDDHVTFRGSQPHSAVVQALERSDILVVPSRSDPKVQLGEGSPVAPKEAMAIGLPVVGTDNGGTPETFPPAYRHELVPQGDSDALAERLVELLADRGSWAERARVGRQWVEQEFDYARLAERLSRVYSDTVSGH